MLFEYFLRAFWRKRPKCGSSQPVGSTRHLKGVLRRLLIHFSSRRPYLQAEERTDQCSQDAREQADHCDDV